MASPEGRRIRERLAAARPADEGTVGQGRRGWEAAVAAANGRLRAAVAPVDLGGVPAERVADGPVAPGRAVLFFHGGGYSAGSPRTHRALGAAVSRAARAEVLLADYRLAPEHPFPAAVEDAVAAYRWVLGNVAAPEGVVVAGDSAGGGLAASLLVRLRNAGIAMPAGAVLISPMLDLAFAGESLVANATSDPTTTLAGLQRAADRYLAGADPRDPVASPVYADPRGFPPLLLQVGGLEILRSDAERFAERALAANVPVELEVWDGMWHVWHAWADELPEGRRAIERIGRFARGRFGGAPRPAAEPRAGDGIAPPSR